MEIYARSTVAASMWEEWCMIETLRYGTQAMRCAGPAYLPKWPMEDDESYKCRIQTSFLFNCLEQTVESLSGRPFAEPLKINENVPAAIASQLDDVDMEGRSLHAFARDVFRSGVAYGHTFILVDFPTTTGAATLADLKATGSRPYMQHVHPQQVLHWEAERIDGVITLTKVCIWEVVDNQAGLFSTLPVMQVRCITQDAFQVWQPQDTGTGTDKRVEWMVTQSGVNTLGKIPLVPFYALRTGFMQSRPPLLDLAYMNVEHWQSASDQRSILHTARVPVLAIITDDENFTIKIGGSNALRLPVGSDAKWVETAGHAIAAGQTDLAALETRMYELGAELIMKSTGKTSATQAQILDGKSESKLGAMAQGLEDCINGALWMWAQWTGESEGGTVEVYQDFGIDEITGTSETLLLQAAAAGKISDETLFAEFQRRGTINPDIKFKDEQARIEAQGPAPGAMGDGLLDVPAV